MQTFSGETPGSPKHVERSSSNPSHLIKEPARHGCRTFDACRHSGDGLSLPKTAMARVRRLWADRYLLPPRTTDVEESGEQIIRHLARVRNGVFRCRGFSPRN